MHSEPVICKINRRANGKLKSVIQYVYPIVKNDKKKARLSFCLFVVILYTTLALLIFLASTIYILASQRSALYSENCVRRSCMSGLNMKCINNTCTCLANQYYMKGCKNKSNYSQQCMNNAKYCVDGQKLTCLDGICKCDRASYWNSNKTICLTKSTYGGSCITSDQCVTTAQITCDFSKNQCLCQSNRFWDGSTCYPQKTINEACSSTLQCITAKYLSCQSSKCSCILPNTWNGTFCTA